MIYYIYIHTHNIHIEVWLINLYFHKIRSSFSTTSRSKNGCSHLKCYKQLHKNLPRVTANSNLLSFWTYYILLITQYCLASHNILHIFTQKFKPIPSWVQMLARSTQVMSEQNVIKKQHTDMEMSYELSNGTQLPNLPKYFETFCQWAYNWLKDLPSLL